MEIVVDAYHKTSPCIIFLNQPSFMIATFNVFLAILKFSTMDYLDYIFVFGLFLIFAAANYLQQKLYFDRQNKLQLQEAEKEKLKLEAEMKKKDKDLVVPMRLQAYERAVLLLERISPASLIFRVQKPNQNVLQLQTLLLKSIRDEFEHNLAQQLYISKEAWAMVKTAKEETVKLINTAASKVQPEDLGPELSKTLFNLLAKKEVSSTESAITMLKNDIHKLF